MTNQTILDRINRYSRGGLDEPVTTQPAGTIPTYYGVDTGPEVAAIWLRMWDGMKTVRPTDEWFYLGNAIGWASR